MPSSRGLPRSPALQADSLPSGPPGGIQTTQPSTEEKSPQSSNLLRLGAALPGSAFRFADRDSRSPDWHPGSQGLCVSRDSVQSVAPSTREPAAFLVTGVKPQGTPGCWGLCAWGHPPDRTGGPREVGMGASVRGVTPHTESAGGPRQVGMGASVRGVTPTLRVQEDLERRAPGQSLQDPRVSPGQGAPRPWCPGPGGGLC